METLGLILLVCCFIELITWDIPKWIISKLSHNDDDDD
jgi:hypothetical protein